MTEPMASFRTIRTRMNEQTFHYCKYFFCFKYKASGRKQMSLLFTTFTCICAACTTSSQQQNQYQVSGLLTSESPPKKAIYPKSFPDINAHTGLLAHLPRAEYLQLSLKPSLHQSSIPIWMNISLNLIAWQFPVLHLKDALCKMETLRNFQLF